MVTTYEDQNPFYNVTVMVLDWYMYEDLRRSSGLDLRGGVREDLLGLQPAVLLRQFESNVPLKATTMENEGEPSLPRATCLPRAKGRASPFHLEV